MYYRAEFVGTRLSDYGYVSGKSEGGARDERKERLYYLYGI